MAQFRGRGNQYVQLSGPLFDEFVIKNFKNAISVGIQSLAEEGVEILQSFIHQSGFIDSGDFVSSVTAEHVQERGAGYSKIWPTASWRGSITSTPITRGRKRVGYRIRVATGESRPPRIWYERGTRMGRRLRKAGGGFRKTRTRLRQLSWERYFVQPISKALN